jgi:hypothetical protein
MDTESPARVGLLIVGVVLIVVGVGLALDGYNQTRAAAEWSSQPHYCGSAGPYQSVDEVTCPKNPYTGGSSQILGGVVFAVIGGLAVRIGGK